ncbi:MAG: hypothetical protein WCA78_00710 [Rhizomicrobium sp.]
MAKDTTVKLVFKKADADRVITWPCTITVPLDGGGSQDQLVTAKFNFVSSERLAQLRATATGSNSDVDLLTECLVGFDGLKNEAGESVSDDDAKALFFSLPYAVMGLARGYYDMLSGRVAKN